MYSQLEQIALSEFSDVVLRAQTMGRRAGVALKLRLHIRDGTIVDVWLSPNRTRYAYHWEQRAKRGLLHRHDSAPDHPHISTFPKHFHDGSEAAVEESYISDEPPTALREFLTFVRAKLAEYGV